MLRYLGCVIDQQGIWVDSEGTQIIRGAWATRNEEGLRSFSGLANRFHQFVENMATRCSQLYKHLENRARWNWVNMCKKVFSKLKDILESRQLACAL